MSRNKRRTRKIVITDNRAVPKGYLLVPERYDPPGPPSAEGPVLLSEEEKKYVEARFGPPTMTRHGLLSYADDSASSTGMSRGDPSQGTVGADNRTSTSSSPQASRGSAIGGSTSRASQSNIGGSQSNTSSSGSSSSHASASNRSSSGGGGPPGGGGQNTGGQNTAGGRGNEAGGVGAQSGGSGAARSGSVAAGTRGGVTNPGGTQGGAQPGSQRTPGGGAQPSSGALGQMARSMAPGTKTPGGGAPPASGQLGQMAGPPRAPGSAAGLLGATRAPQKMQDRIAPSRSSEEGSYPTSTFDPANPIGRPAPTPEEERWNQGIRALIDVETSGIPEEEKLGAINFKARQVLDAAPSPYGGYGLPTLGDVVNWGRRSITAQQDILGTPRGQAATAIGPTQTTTTNIANIAEEMGIPLDTPMTNDLFNAITTRMVQKNPSLSDWDESIGQPKNAAAKAEALADFAAGTPPGLPFGTAVNLRDPVSTAGFDFGEDEPTHGDITPSTFDEPSRTLLGPPAPSAPTYQDMPRRTFIDTKSNLVATKPFQDRVPQDRNFNPAEDNPSYDPMMGDEPGIFGNVALAMEPEPFQEATLNRPSPPFTRNSINSLLGAPKVKEIADRVPSEPSSRVPGSAAGLANYNPAFTPSTRVPGSAAGLNNYSPAFTPSTRVPGSAAALPSLAPFPGRSRVNPMLDQDTEPEPTDITQYGSWPKDLIPSSGMPRGTLRDRLIQDAEDPTQISPDFDSFPQDIRPKVQEPPGFIERVKTAIGLNDNTISDSTIQTAVDLYGPDALPTLQAVGAMFKAGRGRGGSASSLLSVNTKPPKRKRGRPSVVPPDAPLLEA